MKGSREVIAAFDFDGTLTYSDSLIYFLFFAKGWLRTSAYLLMLSPTFLLYVIGRRSRQQVKEKILTQFFGGMPLEEMNRLGASFANQRISSQLKKEGMDRLKWHQQLGHRCILVSASIDAYLKPWAAQTGFQDALTSRLEIKEGKVTGRLQGLNCRAEEKVRRLNELLGPLEGYEIYAYGDSRGDQEMLEAAAHPFLKQFSKEDAPHG